MILYKILFSIKYDNLFYSELENLYFAESQEGKIMANTYPPDLQTAWAHVVARAWKDPEFFKVLTQDPKTALESEPDNEHHNTILSYGGAVFPLPTLEEVAQGIQIPRLAKVPEALEDLREEDLVGFADQEGIFGILRFT
jgi:hypothetical protein